MKTSLKTLQMRNDFELTAALREVFSFRSFHRLDKNQYRLKIKASRNKMKK